MEFLLAGIVLLLMIVTVIQLAFLLSGKGAVETAAHFAARKFALSARGDFRRAKAEAFTEASSMCRHRIGGSYTSLSLTTLDLYAPDGTRVDGPANPGEAYRVTLSHWVELVVPWANRILFAIAPVKKVRLGERYYFVFASSRLVTVE